MFNPYLQGLSGRLKQSNIIIPFHNQLAGWYEDYRIQAFMDAYNAPYNLEYQLWTGLFLLIRCILFLTFAFNASGNPSTNLLVSKPPKYESLLYMCILLADFTHYGNSAWVF